MYTINITEFQAQCMIDFLKAEFIEGIGSDPDLKNNEYVCNIRDFYDKLEQLAGDNE